MKIKQAIAGAGIAVAVAAGTAACSGVGDGYSNTAYVVGRTMCPNQYGIMQNCVIMSDGDLVAVSPSIWDQIMYGMILSPYSGGYHWVRPPASLHVHVTNITHTTSYKSYSSTHVNVKPVTPSAEASQQKSGNTYNSGGSSYKSSPVYKAKQSAAKTGYSSGSKTSYSSTKSNYSTGKTSYSSGKTSYSSGFSSRRK